jgi:hypothetical protein
MVCANEYYEEHDYRAFKGVLLVGKRDLRCAVESGMLRDGC